MLVVVRVEARVVWLDMEWAEKMDEKTGLE